MSDTRYQKLLEILRRAWSIESGTKWTPDNPAKGQCGVTALVVQDLFGGDILKTPMAEGWHFYNRIAGKRLDFTASQFAEEPDYLDLPSHREEVFRDTSEQQYEHLKSKVFQALHPLEKENSR